MNISWFWQGLASPPFTFRIPLVIDWVENHWYREFALGLIHIFLQLSDEITSLKQPEPHFHADTGKMGRWCPSWVCLGWPGWWGRMWPLTWKAVFDWGVSWFSNKRTYTQIKLCQGETACRKHSPAKQNRALKAPLHLALGIFTLETSHAGSTQVYSHPPVPWQQHALTGLHPLPYGLGLGFVIWHTDELCCSVLPRFCLFIF